MEDLGSLAGASSQLFSSLLRREGALLVGYNIMVGTAYRWFERPIRWGIVGGVWAWESSRGSSLGLGVLLWELGRGATGLRRGFGASAGAMMPRAGHWQCLPPVGIAFYSDSIGSIA